MNEFTEEFWEIVDHFTERGILNRPSIIFCVNMSCLFTIILLIAGLVLLTTIIGTLIINWVWM